MLASGSLPIADAAAGPARLQVVAVLLGVLVFGVIVLLVERRSSTSEAAPPGMTSSVPPPPARLAPRRQVYHPPVPEVPTASARDAAAGPSQGAPYPVPFLDPEPPQPEPADSDSGAG